MLGVKRAAGTAVAASPATVEAASPAKEQLARALTCKVSGFNREPVENTPAQGCSSTAPRGVNALLRPSNSLLGWASTGSNKVQGKGLAGVEWSYNALH